MLFANPGLSSQDRSAFRKEKVQSLVKENLTSSNGIPYFWMDEALSETSPGKWTRRTFGELERIVGGFDVLASKVQAIEFHGYHSERWFCPPITFPSQQYGFHLVRSAMDREATIVVVRPVAAWCMAVPGLRKYPNLVRISNPQQSRISSRNVKGGFAKVRRALRAE